LVNFDVIIGIVDRALISDSCLSWREFQISKSKVTWRHFRERTSPYTKSNSKEGGLWFVVRGQCAPPPTSLKS